MVQNPNHKPYDVRFDSFKGDKNKKGTRCRECYIENTLLIWNEEKIKEYIESEGYEYLKNIKGIHGLLTKVKIHCKNPNHKPYDVLFSNFYNKDSRCPYCNESKGEKEISKILMFFNESFQSQHKFDDCKFHRCLPFDFYLPQYNCCIEYDGEQHYKIIKWFGGLDSFIDTKIRDTIKNIYCQQNNIKLIRIPYWDFNRIEEILKKELNL